MSIVEFLSYYLSKCLEFFNAMKNLYPQVLLKNSVKTFYSGRVYNQKPL